MINIAGRYKPTGNNSAGGMGEVIECEDTHLRRRVVIKRLRPGLEQRHLLNEQKLLAQLRSKHVVQLYDIVQLSDRGTSEPAIVLEHIEGELLGVGAYQEDRKYLHVLWQIASGLKDIHQHGIIHRDIKPGNIILDKEGVVKIIDFGLSRENFNAATVNFSGTPVFMAPELWSPGKINFNSKIDVYAFGVTAIALLTSKVPASLQNPNSSSITQSELQALMPSIASDVSGLIFRCLERPPELRPSMEEVCATISRHLCFNSHRATVVFNGKSHFLDKNHRKITLNAAGVGNISIEYNGLDFIVPAVSGHISINNTPTSPDIIMPGCCVITFGIDKNRRFVTFDISHPEIMP